jgi:ATP-dependent RNA helicase RhlE
VCVDEEKLLRDIERLLKTRIEKQVLPGYEPDARIKAEPIQRGRPQRSGGQGNGARQKAGRGKSDNVARQARRYRSPARSYS